MNIFKPSWALSLWVPLFVVGLPATTLYFSHWVWVAPHYWLRLMLWLALASILYYSNIRKIIPAFFDSGKHFTYFGLSAAFITLCTFVTWRFENTSYGDHLVQQAFMNERRYQILAFFLYAVVWGVGLFVHVFYDRLQHQSRLQTLLLEQNVARLQQLRAQINPHFLFNALNKIYAHALKKSDETPDMILELSTILRYSIYTANQTKIDLEQEVLHIKALVDLYLRRSHQPQSISFTVKGVTAGCLIEPMLLIPLVENCFKHSDVDYNPAGKIMLTLEVDYKSIRFATYNTLDAQWQAATEKAGVGLENIRKRLALQYGATARLETAGNNQEFSAVITLPYERA